MISVENERNFESMLFADASALPPPQDAVTPWHTAMHYILWGLGLTTITLRFLNLDVILTAVGAALLVLGFRILRQENAPLRWGFRLALAALAVRSTCYVLAALPVEVVQEVLSHQLHKFRLTDMWMELIQAPEPDSVERSLCR